MRRRQFLGGLGAASLLPQFARAQSGNRVYRLAHLANSATSEVLSRQITLPELARLGFFEGRNLIFDSRVGNADALPELMRELLAATPDAVNVIGPEPLTVAGAATRTVPIICFGADTVLFGLAASYARPGGNVTGVTILNSELEGKRLDILRQALPGRRRMAALVTPGQKGLNEAALRKAATAMDLDMLPFSVSSPADYPAAFAAMRAARAEGLVIGATPEFNRDAKQLATLALEARLPTVCEWADLAHQGCMIGYGPNRVALRKRMTAQIVQIFNGAPVADIAIELPTIFESAINLKVARSLGLDIPQAVVIQADEVVE